MDETQETLLRQMLGDLLAAKPTARKVIIENIITLVKKLIGRVNQ